MPGNFASGIILLILVVVIWVTSSNVLQFLFQDSDFPKPLFTTWASTSLFSIYLLINPMVKRFSKPKSDGLLGQDIVSYASFKHHLYKAFLFAPLWLVANLCYNSSLLHTSVTANTIISSSSSFFTFFFCIITGRLKFKFLSLISILCTVLGVGLIAWNDRSGTHTLLGDVLALLGAVFYGIYTTTLDSFLSTKPGKLKLNVLVFWGLTGVLCLFVYSPLLFLFHILHIERFSFPSTRILFVILLNASIGTVLSDLIWSYALMLTNPLVAALGISLTIPLALIIDLVREKVKLNLEFIVGAVLTICAFSLISILNNKKKQKDIQLIN
ncbi:hypothetical protein RCL1_000511 [Eukaryota sp. TZLM3-RCL]